MLGKLTGHVVRVGVLLIAAALIAGMVGCGPSFPPLPHSQNLKIRTWYDLDAVRGNLTGSHILMNDLDSTTAGYAELASPTANQGKGWGPIGILWVGLRGTFDGQGYEIRDLFINRPDEDLVGLFGEVDRGATVKNIGVVNATLTGKDGVGGLVGENWGTISGSYCTGNVTGDAVVGGLVGATDPAAAVNNSYSTCSVTGHEFVGGLVGGNAWGGTMNNCYSTGGVTGNDSVGGLVGDNTREGAVSNSFWDTETSGQATSDSGTGKTTAEMQDIATFLGAGWNIVTVANLGTRNPSHIWNIVDGVTYPFLSWQD
jgi:hypothetical protein